MVYLICKIISNELLRGGCGYLFNKCVEKQHIYYKIIIFIIW